MGALRPYLQLMRPANVVTAVADVLAGSSIAMAVMGDGSSTSWAVLLLLSLSTIGLYGGGVVFNDVFDADLDAIERPERPIPSGRVSRRNAAWFAATLFAIGVGMAMLVHVTAGGLSMAIVASCLIYDKWAKHHGFFGPIVMGLCRGLNLLLGVSYAVPAVPERWLLAFVPVLYIAAVTSVSRGEVHGGRRFPLVTAVVLYAVVIGMIVTYGAVQDTGILGMSMVLPFALFVIPPLAKAIQTLNSSDIRKSVKHGVLGLMFMNAAWAAASGIWWIAAAVLAFFPVSIWLSKQFAIT